MAIKQLSIFVENKKGALAATLKCLSDKKVGLRALSIADTNDFGILRVIADDAAEASAALAEEGIIFSVNEVIAADADDRPGGLADILAVLMDADIDIEYVYAFVTETGKRACAILRLGDNEAGEKVLRQAGITLISEDEILRI